MNKHKPLNNKKYKGPRITMPKSNIEPDPNSKNKAEFHLQARNIVALANHFLGKNEIEFGTALLKKLKNEKHYDSLPENLRIRIERMLKIKQNKRIR